MASAKPVISTRQGGALEMVLDNKTGYFIPINDPQKSAAILQKVLARQADFIQLGINGYARVTEFFSLSAFKKSWLNLFQSL
jgi:glycosyltransferase involved in cell wall biosynthesis